ncbi:MAG: ABC transporter permease subunit [Thermoprotei archaeon]|nr:ABC transporter permease subunit [Thermoprotei archaeon]
MKWDNIKLITSFTFSDNIRMKRTFALVVLFVILFVASMRLATLTVLRRMPGLPKALIRISPQRLFLNNLLSNLALLLPFIGVMFGYDAISGEKERGTLRMILTQPIYRDEFLIGKFLGALSTIAFVILVSQVIAMGVSMAIYGIGMSMDLLWKLILFMLFSILYSISWYAIALLISVISNRTSYSALISIAIALSIIIIAPILVSVYVTMVNPPPIFTGSESPSTRQNAIRKWLMETQRLRSSLMSFSPDFQFQRLLRGLIGISNDLSFQALLSETANVLLGSTLSLTYLVLMALIPLIASFMIFVKQELK